MPAPMPLPEPSWTRRSEVHGTAVWEQTVQAQPPAPPPPPGGGGGGRGGGGGGRGPNPAGDPAGLMDQLLGAQPVAELRSIGAATRGLASEISVRGENPEPLLAGIYWWAVMHGRQLRRRLTDLGVGTEGLQFRLVAHAEATRFDLLVLSPEYDGDPVRLRLDTTPPMLARTFEDLAVSSAGTVADRLRQRYPRVTDRLVRNAIAEVARTDWFGAVLAPEQEMIPTGVPDPGARVVNLADPDRPASVGLVLRSGEETFATTVRHVFVGGRGEARIGAAQGKVCREDLITDSCLIALERDPCLAALAGYSGVLRSILPPVGERAWFSRPEEGRVETVVMDADMSILEPQQDFASKVYTRADTIVGDSGVALVDSANRVVCFAVSRTSMRAALASSQWIYAEQALTALGVLEELS
ncbi:hypothetical protein [Streptomyces sp. NBC_00076]|uniref:hypothetical protein n=1 Tax=Streptomyces sp. NBC_00076 TaxID=2975642 RepID=UPI00324CADF4